MRQSGKPKMPIFYFTELIGHALALPASPSWFNKHLINPTPLLANLKLI
jgi:heterodisulfide reductase subunit B2